MKQSRFTSWMQTFVIFVLVMIAEFAPHVSHCLNPNYLHVPKFQRIYIGDYCEKIYSSMNCSRKPRPSIENDYPLHCKVGRQKDWEDYHETINKTLKCSVDECQPPVLSSLQTEWMIPSGSRKIHHPTLKLDFLIPKTTPERNFYTGAILMTFSSSNDREVGDKDFPTRYRLLDFSDYTYSNPDNDRNYQRHLNFSCFIGYQHETCQSDKYKVYTVTFTAFSKKRTGSNETLFSELAYDFTIYSYYVYHKDLWKPTIAIAKYPDPYDVTVVFDPAPPEYNVNKYEIAVVDAIKNITIKTKVITRKSKNNNCAFSSLSDGRYYIEVTTIRENCDSCMNAEDCDSCRNTTRSHEFEISRRQWISRSYTSPNKHILGLSISSGTVFALALLGLLFYCKGRRDPIDNKLKEKPKCFLVYSNREEINCEIAKEFVECFRNQLQVDVIFHQEEEAKLKPYDPVWCEEKFKMCSIAIILCFQDFLNMAAAIALCKKHNDGLKIACVYFDPSHFKSIPKDFRHGVKSFLLMKDLKKLHRYLHGNKNISVKIINKRLEIAINRLKQKSLENELKIEDVALNEYDHLIDEEISCSEIPFRSDDLERAPDTFSKQTCPIDGASGENQSENMCPKSFIGYERSVEKQIYPNRNSHCLIDSDLSSVSSIDIVLPNSECPIHGFDAWRAKKMANKKGSTEISHDNNKSPKMPCHLSSEDDNSEILQQFLEINSLTSHGNRNETLNTCCNNRTLKHERDVFSWSQEADRHQRLQCSLKRELMFEQNYDFSVSGFCRCRSSHSITNADFYSHSSDSIDSEELNNELSKYV